MDKNRNASQLSWLKILITNLINSSIILNFLVGYDFEKFSVKDTNHPSMVYKNKLKVSAKSIEVNEFKLLKSVTLIFISSISIVFTQ